MSKRRNRLLRELEQRYKDELFELHRSGNCIHEADGLDEFAHIDRSERYHLRNIEEIIAQYNVFSMEKLEMPGNYDDIMSTTFKNCTCESCQDMRHYFFEGNGRIFDPPSWLQKEVEP
jgi:hypothetical protein